MNISEHKHDEYLISHWSEPNDTIAKALGVSPNRISNRRKELRSIIIPEIFQDYLMLKKAGFILKDKLVFPAREKLVRRGDRA